MFLCVHQNECNASLHGMQFPFPPGTLVVFSFYSYPGQTGRAVECGMRAPLPVCIAIFPKFILGILKAPHPFRGISDNSTHNLCAFPARRATSTILNGDKRRVDNPFVLSFLQIRHLQDLESARRIVGPQPDLAQKRIRRPETVATGSAVGTVGGGGVGWGGVVLGWDGIAGF